MSARCPTPRKVAHPTQADAAQHFGSLRAKEGKAGTWSLRIYKCRCGAWHIGGKRKAFGRRRRQW